MPRCSYHPDVETEVSCVECGRYICPKDMVASFVGYKCRDCARPVRSQYVLMKPKQAAGAAGLGLAAGVGGGLILGMIGFGFFIIWLGWGALVGEAARRGSGGHRGPIIATIAALSVLAGGFVGGIGLFGIVLGIVGVIATVGWGWGR